LLDAILDGGKALGRQVFFAAAGRALLGHAPNCTLPPALDAGVHRNPVDFPGLAAVVREGLLEAARIGGNVRPDVPYQDAPAVDRLLVEELAAAVLEFAYGGNAQAAAVGIGRVQAP